MPESFIVEKAAAEQKYWFSATVFAVLRSTDCARMKLPETKWQNAKMIIHFFMPLMCFGFHRDIDTGIGIARSRHDDLINGRDIGHAG